MLIKLERVIVFIFEGKIDPRETPTNEERVKPALLNLKINRPIKTPDLEPKSQGLHNFRFLKSAHEIMSQILRTIIIEST